MSRRSRCRRKGCPFSRDDHELIAWVELLKLTPADPALFRPPPQDGGTTPEGR